MWLRLNLIVLFAIMTSAMSVIVSQHQSRRLYSELDRAKQQQIQLDVVWDQLQYEQRTWSKISRVDEIATKEFKMTVVNPSRTYFITEQERNTFTPKGLQLLQQQINATTAVTTTNTTTPKTITKITTNPPSANKAPAHKGTP
jgi:cell division protein FtsL